MLMERGPEAPRHRASVRSRGRRRTRGMLGAGIDVRALEPEPRVEVDVCGVPVLHRWHRSIVRVRDEVPT
jgi:hypothetical protein